MKQNLSSTQPSIRKTSTDSCFDIKSSKSSALKSWLVADIKKGLRALSHPKQNLNEVKRITGENFLKLSIHSTLKCYRDETILKKGINLVINALRMAPKFIEINNEKIKIFIDVISQLMTRDRHCLYLSLKLLKSLLKFNPKIQKKISSSMLRKMGKNLNKMLKTQQQKKKLKMVVEVLNLLPKHKRIPMASGVLTIRRDFPILILSDQIEQILNLAPLAYLQKIVDFLKTAEPEETTLRHLASLLHQLMKYPEIAKQYYYKGIDIFFHDILRSTNFSWCNSRFILIFIADFSFIWKNLRFKPDFIKKFIQYIDQNPNHLEFLKDRIRMIDTFLMQNHIRNISSNFSNEMKIVKNQEFVLKTIFDNYQAKIDEETIPKNNFSVIGKFLLRKTKHLNREQRREIFVSKIEKRNLLKNLKNQNSQLFLTIGSQLGQKDFGLLGNHRNGKLLKIMTNIGEKLNKKNPNFSKTQMKKILGSKLSVSLKREGFELERHTRHDIMPTVGKGVSRIKIIEFFPKKNENRKYLENNDKNFTICFEMDFSFKIRDFVFFKNFIHFWGHSNYWILEVKTNKNWINEHVLGKKIEIKFLKKIDHCLVDKVIPFDNNYIGIIPKDEEKTLQLFNIEKKYFSFVNFSKKKMLEIRKKSIWI